MNIQLNPDHAIESVETFSILDASKIQEYLGCPRKFFFRYVLGWRAEGTAHALIFGEAWHRAMEHLLLHGYGKSSISEAFEQFMTYYREYFSPEQDFDFRGKSPQNALNALVKYTQYWKNDAFETLYTEVSGKVLINEEGDFLTYRLDSICRDLETKAIFSLEHKTGSYNSQAWADQWKMKTQTNLYLHALYSLYHERDNIKGLIVNGTFFTKEPSFTRVPIIKTAEQLDYFLVWLNQIVESIKDQFSVLDIEKPSDRVMISFPRNTENCTKWNRACPFLHYCDAWNNPLQHCGIPPFGFEVDHWNPLDREAKTTIDINLKKKGDSNAA